MKRKEVEILAPAGSFESMKAAVAAGADAVYIGGARFGARAFADNPDEEQLLEAIDYVHLHGCKLYLTVNTLMKDQEMEELYDYLKPYYQRGLDAVIVQDMGVFSFIRRRFPLLPIHASTQMTITGAYGARILKELGAARVVTARELSLDEIRRIHKETDVEIESFVHGALCYCYSGQCLFSSLIGGRSGNRGRCAQTCRLPFEVKTAQAGRGARTLNGKNEKYCLSLKDLCTLDLIPDLVEAGIFSMKIEGRMKSPRYTAGVVSIYRKYVDLYLEQGRNGYQVSKEDRKRLLDLFDRGGQTDGYYRRHNGPDMVVWKEKPGFREGNQKLYEELDENFVNRQVREPIVGTAYLREGQPALLTVEGQGRSVTVSGDVVLTAQNQPLSPEKVKKQLNKTGNTPFYFEKLEAETQGAVFLPVQSLNDLRRRGLEELEKKILEQFFRKEEEAWTEDEKTEREKTEQEGMKLFVSLERPECFDQAVKALEVSRIYIDSAKFCPDTWKNLADKAHKAGKECMLTMPHIFRTEAECFFDRHRKELTEAGFDGFLLRSLEECGYLREKQVEGRWIFDYGLYGMNGQAQEELLKLGASELTWPVELNSRELGKLKIPGELLVYGRLPMMVTAQCLNQGTEGCDKTPKLLFLKDRLGKEFPVRNHCTFCYNTIYNEAPLSLLGLEEEVKALSPKAVRLQFTTEDEEQMSRVLECFLAGFLHGEKLGEPLGAFTRGHFKRGVE